MTDPAEMECGACCGRGYMDRDNPNRLCVRCEGEGVQVQQGWQCRHFVAEWEGCEQCFEDERWAETLSTALASAAFAARSQTSTIPDIIAIEAERASLERLYLEEQSRADEAHRSSLEWTRVAARHANERDEANRRIAELEAERDQAVNKAYPVLEELRQRADAAERAVEKYKKETATAWTRIADLEAHVAKAARVAAQALGTIEWFYRNKNSISPDSLVGDELREIAALAAPASPAKATKPPNIGALTCKRCHGTGRIQPGDGVMTCGDCCGDGLAPTITERYASVSLDSHSKETK